jgi:hypothetical protein
VKTNLSTVCVTKPDEIAVTTTLNTIIIYAKNMQRTAEFYQKFFGFLSRGEVVEGLIEILRGNIILNTDGLLTSSLQTSIFHCAPF